MTDGEAGENPPSGAPSFDVGRRSGGRAVGRLPVHVALEELEEYERSADAPRRRWTDSEPEAASLPPFAPADSLPAAILVDDDAAGPTPGLPVPSGGPQFLGRVSAPVGPPERRRFRRGGTPDAPPPGTRLSAWSRTGPVVPPQSPRAGRATRGVVWLLVIVCLGVGVVAGYPRVRALLRERSVPAALHSYVSGQGVRFAPAGQGFTVLLPESPVRRDQPLNAADGTRSMFMHRSIASGAGYEIVIRVIDVPAGVSLPYGAVGVLADPRVGGAAPFNLRRVSYAGQAAYDYDLHSNPATAASVLLHGSRVYVITVQSKSAGTVLQAVTKSFRFTT